MKLQMYSQQVLWEMYFTRDVSRASCEILKVFLDYLLAK